MAEKSNDPSTLSSPWAKPNGHEGEARAAVAIANDSLEPVTSNDNEPSDGVMSRKKLSGERRQRIGDYILLEEIAHGAMGVVYRARQVSLNRIVAVKLAQSSSPGSIAETQRFRFEAEAAARLDHPNIVPIYEVGELDGQAYFSMALVEGKSLAEKIAVDPIPPREAARLMSLAADAVAYAHNQGVVHRDLKPANILLDDSGQPRITDFGLAKIADTDSSITRAGEVLGTPNYMPPEQAAGRNSEVGTSADVYSLGATLYALVTGRPPFQSATVLETLSQVIDREPISPRTLNPAVDRDLDTICLKCLAKKPEQRYASASSLADDLRRFLEGKSIVARPVGQMEKVVRWCRRNVLAASSLFAVAGIFAIAFGLVSWSYYRAEDARAEESKQRLEAQRRERGERWERYRANIGNAASALRLHNVNAARQALKVAPEEFRNWEWRHFHSRLDEASASFVAHRNEVTHEVFAPWADVVGTFAAGEGFRLWNFRSGKLIRAIESLPELVTSQISLDGSILACERNLNEVAIYDVASGRLVSTLRGHEKRITSFSFSDDSTRIATGSMDRTARIWEVASGKQLQILRGHQHMVGRIEFSADNRWLVSAGWHDSTARVWDLHSGKLQATLPYPNALVVNLRISPDGDRVVINGEYPHTNVLMWECRTGRLLATLRGHSNQVATCQFNNDGSRLVTASWDQDARLWDGKNGKPIAVLHGHSGRVMQAHFSPDAKRILTVSHDQTLRLWDADTGDPVAILHGHKNLILGAHFDRVGKSIVSIGSDGSCRIWDTEVIERNGRFRGHMNFAYEVAFSPDGAKVASVSWDGTARIWNADTGECNLTIRYPTSVAVSALAMHPSGEVLATLGRDSAIRFWNCRTGAQMHECPLKMLSWKDPRLAFNKSGDRLAAGGQDKAVHLWDVTYRAESSAGKPDAAISVSNERLLKGHTDVIRDVVFDRADRWIASAGDEMDKTVRIWDSKTGKEVETLTGHTNCVYCLAVSRDGSLLASGSVDGKIRIWETATWSERAMLPIGSSVFGLSFNADGSRLACGCSDNTVRLLDMVTFQEVAELYGHESYVHSVNFSPDGNRLISASGDFTLKMWDTSSATKRLSTIKSLELEDLEVGSR